VAPGFLQVGCHHFLTHPVRGNFENSAQLLPGLGGISQQGVYLGGAKVMRVDIGAVGLPDLYGE
jgi:hypothetical protein